MGLDSKFVVLSLGAGVQSSVMALMAARGELTPMPDAAIFADTQFEPRSVYAHLDWLEKQLPFPVYRVSKGNLKDDCLSAFQEDGSQFASIPFFTDKRGMLRRQCTGQYKITPVYKKTRELLGLAPYQRPPKNFNVEQWIGISLDEIQRMKENSVKWIHNRWPLIENEITREDCIQWFADKYPIRQLTKSACIVCPYRTNEEWLSLTDEEFEEACLFDEKLRSSANLRENIYLHQSRTPLRSVDLLKRDVGYSFNDECDGMCGV